MREVTETEQEGMAALAEDSGPGATAMDSYLWQAPGKSARVLLDFDVVDRLLQEVMRGFGVIPKRGVEVGGLLLGSFRKDGSVRVTDFEPIPCQHSRGSSYLLSEDERERFRSARERWSGDDPQATQAVGFYRSHTRDGFGLGEEDIETFNGLFGQPNAVVLLVKPFATRVSSGAFFFREDGGMKSDASYLEFPFRRKELGGPEPGAEPVAAEPLPPEPPAHLPQFSFGGYADSRAKAAPEPPAASRFTDDGSSAGRPPEPEKSGSKPMRTDWVWIPLSFIFLLLGVIVGVQVALSISNKLPASLRPPDPYTMHLTASPSGDSVHVRWDRSAPAIQDAPRGVLHIQDGAGQQRVELDALQLQNGSVIYRRATGEVNFRLEVMTRDRVTVSETTEFKAR